jgi:tol-pal system protein YbgF
MRTGYQPWVFLMVLALLSSACAVTAEQFQGLQQDVRALREDLNTRAKQLIQLEAMVKGAAAGTPTPDLVARFEELTAETRMIQGRLEEDSHRLSELSQRLDGVELKLSRVTTSEPGVRPGTPAPGQSPVPPGTMPKPSAPGEQTRPTVPPPSTPVPGQPLPPAPTTGTPVSPQPPTGAPPSSPAIQTLPSPEEVYKTALSDYTKGSYDLAISGFKTYLTFFPKTSLVPNAQYWLAESYYSKGEYRQAIQEFAKVIKDYPDSTKVPSAMLKQGYAYLELGEAVPGQAILRELVNRFPRSREARLAQDRLERPQ